MGWSFTGQPVIFPVSFRFNPREVMGLTDEYRPSTCLMVPTQWKKLLDFPELKNYDTDFVSLAFSGGAPFPGELKKDVIRTFPNIFLIDGFGQTEVSAAVLYKADADEEEVKDRCIGRPAPGVDVRIVDEQGRDVPKGEVGEIIYRGDVVMKGSYTLDQKVFKYGISKYIR